MLSIVVSLVRRLHVQLALRVCVSMEMKKFEMFKHVLNIAWWLVAAGVGDPNTIYNYTS